MTSPISDDAMEAIRAVCGWLTEPVHKSPGGWSFDEWMGRRPAVAERAAAVLARIEAEKWQDISTALKDGTRVDLWHEDWGRQTDCYWGFPEHCCGEAGVHCDSDWHRLDAGWVDGTMNEAFDPNSFTHWRPVPAPPIGSGRILADADKEPSP